MVYERKTKKECKDVFDKANEFFKTDLGLEGNKEGECVSYSGGGGHIKITCCKEDDKSVVEIATREWDRQVKKFLKKI